MKKIKIIWGPWTSSIYSFQTQTEVDAFRQGLSEAQAHIADCPEFVVTEEPEETHSTTISPWYQLLFSVFIGAWAFFWWFRFNDVKIALEYMLVGLVATLVSYIFMLLYHWRKKRA